jgi:hypothetical protein
MLYFIYYILKIKEAYILLCFKHVFNYIKRRYSLKVKIFYRNGETII